MSAEVSAHCRSAATWYSKCILSTFGLFSRGGPQSLLSADNNILIQLLFFLSILNLHHLLSEIYL